MSDTSGPTGYNGGKYTFEQQTFCLSMLTCLSFNLTGWSAADITRRFRASVEAVLADSSARELVGKWNLVWGPVIYADSFVGALASVNSVFIAVPESDPGRAVIAIAGTNGVSLMGWMVEDFNVKETIAWPYGNPASQPHLSRGIAYALGKVQALAEHDPVSGRAVTIRDYLARNASIRQVMITGHSLGGALAPVYSLYLEDTRGEWDAGRGTVIECLATAGQTPGDEAFSRYYGEKLAARTTRVWNSLDIVPHAYEPEKLVQIPPIYEPQIHRQRPVDKLINNLLRETSANRYLNILPEVPGFPSAFISLNDIAGEKYKTFVDFINNVARLVKRVNLFGSKDAVGTVDFAVHALIQHIFPYFGYFGIDEFIKIMCSPVARPRVEGEVGKGGGVLKAWTAFVRWLKGLRRRDHGRKE